jgi:hypothetical protein
MWIHLMVLSPATFAPKMAIFSHTPTGAIVGLEFKMKVGSIQSLATHLLLLLAGSIPMLLDFSTNLHCA